MLARQMFAAALAVCLSLSAVHAQDAAEPAPFPDNIQDAIKLVNSATAESLPGIMKQVAAEDGNKLPPSALMSVRMMVANRAIRLELGQPALDFLSESIKKSGELDSPTYRSMLTMFGGYARSLTNENTAISQMKEFEPPVEKVLQHGQWTTAIAGLHTPEEGKALVTKELVTVREAAAKESNDDYAMVQSDLLAYLALRSEPAAALVHWQEVYDVTANAIKNGGRSPQLAQGLMSSVTRVLMATAELSPDDLEAQSEKYLSAIAELGEATESESIKAALKSGPKQMESILARAKADIERNKMIGNPAPDFPVAATLNGEPTTLAQLKGKVVLIDFWAVWCGPCIATFPHLRHWHEEYADDGLVILGVTNYYNMNWDEKSDGPKRATEGEVSADDEHAMITKFAAKHELAHRLLVCPKDDPAGKYYKVNGIPQAVLIDRAGNVQMIKIGSGEPNAMALEAKIKELLAQ